MRLIILSLITALVLVSISYAVGPDVDWTTCRNLTIISNYSFDMGNQSIFMNITGLNINASAINETRIANAGCDDGGVFINFTIVSTDNSTWEQVMFITEETHTPSTNLTYSVYYNT